MEKSEVASRKPLMSNAEEIEPRSAYQKNTYSATPETKDEVQKRMLTHGWITIRSPLADAVMKEKVQ
jgi:hypothetical protein